MSYILFFCAVFNTIITVILSVKYVKLFSESHDLREENQRLKKYKDQYNELYSLCEHLRKTNKVYFARCEFYLSQIVALGKELHNLHLKK